MEQKKLYNKIIEGVAVKIKAAINDDGFDGNIERLKKDVLDSVKSELISEESRHKKLRNTKEIEKAFRKGNPGFSAIRSIVVLTAENPDTRPSSRKDNKKSNRSLLQYIKDANYKYVPAVGKFDNKENSYVVVNMSIETAKRICGKHEQTSFVFSKFDRDGSVHSEYWEKDDKTKPYSKDNDYVKKDESEEWIDCSDADDNYTIVGKKFKFSIPFSIFESIDATMLENLRSYIRRADLKEATQSDIDVFLDFAINRVGYTPAMYRKVLTKSLMD